jgi:NADH-quinone oxidoreductase subunit J
VLLDTIIFYSAAVFAIGGAVMMITQRNPIASVLYLIVSLVAQAILYIQLSALFLGDLLIIIYAGAFMVLFLFVIMILNLRGEQFEGKQSKLGGVVKLTFATIFFIEIVFIIRQVVKQSGGSIQSAQVTEDFGSVEMVATRLFREYLYPFELTSVLLLVAIVGAVVIAKREKSEKGRDK